MSKLHLLVSAAATFAFGLCGLLSSNHATAEDLSIRPFKVQIPEVALVKKSDSWRFWVQGKVIFQKRLFVYFYPITF